jgi:hypothetical protein
MKYIFLIVIVAIFSIAIPVSAYSGAFAIFPASSVLGSDVARFEVRAEENSPFVINTDLSYLYKVEITLSKKRNGNLTVIEDNGSFSITVNEPIQKDMLEAKLYIWAPNADSLSIIHSHEGETDVILYGTKVTPQVTRENGDVLWVVTTPSFSEFHIEQKSLVNLSTAILPLLLVALMSYSCHRMFRDAR